jgi:hypothetical protein
MVSGRDQLIYPSSAKANPDTLNFNTIEEFVDFTNQWCMDICRFIHFAARL